MLNPPRRKTVHREHDPKHYEDGNSRLRLAVGAVVISLVIGLAVYLTRTDEAPTSLDKVDGETLVPDLGILSPKQVKELETHQKVNHEKAGPTHEKAPEPSYTKEDE